MRNIEKIREELDKALTFLDYENAFHLIKEGLRYAQLSQNLFYEYFFYSQLAILNEDFEEAIKYLDKALKINPYDEHCYNDKALCLADLGNTEEALRCIEEGLKKCPDSKMLYQNRGWILLQKGDYQKAILNLKKSLEFDDTYSVAWANLAECLKHEADFKTALKYYKKSLSLIPKKYKDLIKEIKDQISKISKVIERRNDK